MAIQGDERQRCRACEGFLGTPTKANPTKYGIVANKHGAVTRNCTSCNQHYIYYVQEYPKGKMKIIAKMIDKVL